MTDAIVHRSLQPGTTAPSTTDQPKGLADKIVDGLNEVRTLMLGATILLGFQFQAVFQPSFRDLPRHAQALDLGAMGLMLLAFTLLAAVAPFHRVLEQGNATARLHRFITLVIEIALWPFASCLGIDLFIVAERQLPPWLAAVIGAGFIASALWSWRVLAGLRRQHIHKGGRMSTGWRDPGEIVATPLKDKISQIMTEGRVILPGAQAMLGFQFAAVLTDAFARLPETSRLVHLGGLAAMTLAVILLMSPPCYHRIVGGGDARPDVDRYGVRMMLGALLPLALGLAADLYVVVATVLQAPGVARGVSAFALLIAAGLWMGVPLGLRRRDG